MNDVVLLSGLIFATAVLFSSVGQAGASGYLAVMALCGMEPDAMKPAALVLNVLVASIATVRFFRAGCFSWRLFWPTAVASMPLAFLGGAITLPGSFYKPVVGGILLFAALCLLLSSRSRNRPPPAKSVPMPSILASGAGIGLLSGLTGTGGGTFLSPLLLFMGWAEARESAGVSAAFNLANSVAALAGLLSGVSALPAALPYWAIAAVCGGVLGSELGSRRLGSTTLLRLLATVLVVAGAKLMLA